MTHESMQIAASSSPPDRAEWAELAEAIDLALDQLPDAQREALMLRESGGFTFAQIAETLDLPLATVKSRVRYALMKLSEQLKPFREELKS